MKNFFELFFVFFKVGAMTFGGGLAMLPILEHELCEKRKWIERETLYDYYVIGQATPGIIAVNVATFVGYTKKKISGACVATFGIVAPSLIIITAIAATLSNFAELEAVKKCLVGVNVGVSAMMANTFCKFAQKAIIDAKTCLIFIASFVALKIFNAPSVAIIAISASLGIALKRIKK